MQKPTYELEIYGAGSDHGDDPLVSFKSTSPFTGISKGELLTPLYAHGQQDTGLGPGRGLRVVEVHHLLWSTEKEVKQKTMIFTELYEY